MMRAVALICLPLAAVDAATIAADSSRGAELFETLHCIQCHRINGKGGTVGPDLEKRIDRNFTPASLAATIWNHAPTMWRGMSERDIPAAGMNEQAANDLFAFFYAARFFEKPGDAGRGKALFEAKHCADCHGITEAKLAAAKPASQWESIGHPIVLVDAMWNHGATMREQFAVRKLPWPELTSQDLTDMLVYLRNLPGLRNVTGRFFINSGANGGALFQSKGCAACHQGKLALAPRLKNKTLTDVAVAMWDHEPRMAAVPPQLTVEEMRDIVSYLWAQEFFETAGDAVRGERVFRAKHCAMCHNDAASGAPKLPRAGESHSAAGMVAALWVHGPRMLTEMQRRGVAWPRFDDHEMSNLIAYLNRENGK